MQGSRGGSLWELRSDVAGTWGRVQPEPRAPGRRPGGGSTQVGPTP